MLYSGTDPESYITEYTSVYEEKRWAVSAEPPVTSSSGISRGRLGARLFFFSFLLLSSLELSDTTVHEP